MVFSSDTFLLGFLPVAYLMFLLARATGHRQLVVGWLIIASLFFYGWWNVSYLALILISIAANYSLGRVLHRWAQKPRGRLLLASGVVANLGTIAYYKYAGFFVGVVNDVYPSNLGVGEILLPLAISFFTFQQIAFLVDSYRGETREYGFLDYCLYVVFFPQLIAGPIVYHREAIPQYQGGAFFSAGNRDLSIGLTMLVLGLAKKVLLADNLAAHANSVFDAAAQGNAIDPATAWTGALAYTFQLYFDFSGYSDMAIGLARMFGIRLPFNFNSPYKATSIVDFWRRWHITLSRFLREYLYFSLGGNRRGFVRRYVNLLVTMVLGGLWHGAGWSFLIWGALHGVYLIINHGWVKILKSFGLGGIRQFKLYVLAAWSITFAAVVVGWVFFRADDVGTALAMLNAMIRPWAEISGATLQADLIDFVLIAVAMTIAILLPNTQQWVGLREPGDDASHSRRAPVLPLPVWRPTVATAAALGILAFAVLYSLRSGSEFLYFRF
jgi:alginate O-acetyltransferase complex protein AlgI